MPTTHSDTNNQISGKEKLSNHCHSAHKLAAAVFFREQVVVVGSNLPIRNVTPASFEPHPHFASSELGIV